MKMSTLMTATLCGAVLFAAPRGYGDAVTDWNAHLEEVVLATAEPIPAHTRSAAMVHVAIFDAVNGIERRYAPYHVTKAAPRGARPEAAAIQAAYSTLRALYPAQGAVLDAHLADSLANLPGGRGKSQSIARGRAWGERVAQEILALRSTDGWTDPLPPVLGGFAPGQWRSLPFGSNPDGTVGAAFPQQAVLTPFAMHDPAQFRPEPPYGALIPECLLTAAYTADFEEVKALGRVDSAIRTAEQSDLARLWQALGTIDENRAARSVVSGRRSLVDNARLFALLNIAACDALIIGWDSKFAYELWRPHHAIRLADTDGNPGTVADSEWTALIFAPRFPEYVSNHSTLTGAIMRVLARELGDEHAFSLESPFLPGVRQHYARFSDAAVEAQDARVWGGIHFRRACEVGGELGVALADFVVRTQLTPRCRGRY